jgi:nicotinamidase-related amidase
VVFGVQSECCVQETSLSALKAGLGVTLLHGAHSTYDTADCSAEEIEASVEKLLCSRGAQVLDFEAAVRSWKAAGMVE